MSCEHILTGRGGTVKMQVLAQLQVWQ